MLLKYKEPFLLCSAVKAKFNTDIYSCIVDSWYFTTKMFEIYIKCEILEFSPRTCQSDKTHFLNMFICGEGMTVLIKRVVKITDIIKTWKFESIYYVTIRSGNIFDIMVMSQ